MTHDRKFQYAVIVALIAVYVALRLWRLTESCLWFDEIFGVHVAEHSWNSIFWFVAQDVIHPPFFYVLLKLWIGLAGESLLWLRLFPALFSVVALVPFVQLCRELQLKIPATILALAFFSVSGSLIKYAQEVRMYSVLLCLSLFSIWVFARFFYRGKNIWVLTLVNFLLVYTHYFGWFVVFAEVAAIATFQRIKIRQALVMLGISIVSFVPWIIAVVQAGNVRSDVRQNIGWISRPGLRATFDLVFDVIEPFYFQQSSDEVSTRIFITLPLFILIVTATVAYFVGRISRSEKKDRVQLPTILCFVPLILAFGLSWTMPVSIWGSRHLIVAFAPIFVLIAIFIDEISSVSIRYSINAATAILFVVSFVVFVRTPTPELIWCAWEPLAKQWAEAPHNSPQPKTLYTFEDMVAYHTWFATREFPNHKIAVVDGIEGLPNDPAYFLPRGFDSVARIDFQDIDGEQIWILFRGSAPTENTGVEILERGFKRPVTDLESRGYTIEDVQKISGERQTAYLIKMQRLKRPSSP